LALLPSVNNDAEALEAGRTCVPGEALGVFNDDDEIDVENGCVFDKVDASFLSPGNFVYIEYVGFVVEKELGLVEEVGVVGEFASPALAKLLTEPKTGLL